VLLMPHRLVLVALLATAAACGNVCEEARDIQMDKCGADEGDFNEDAIAECKGAAKDFAECVVEHDDLSCADLAEECL
jgi:hypothetical protein